MRRLSKICFSGSHVDRFLGKVSHLTKWLTAEIELKIDATTISKICRKVKYHKTAISKNDGQKYRFEFVK